MKAAERAAMRKQMKEQKEKHMDEMVDNLKKTRNFILVTDKYTAMTGENKDIFNLIHKMFEWLFDRTPVDVHKVYADYLEDLANEIRKNL